MYMQQPICDISFIYKVSLFSTSPVQLSREEIKCKGVCCTFEFNCTNFLFNFTDEYQLQLVASNQFNLSRLFLLKTTISKCLCVKCHDLNKQLYQKLVVKTTSYPRWISQVVPPQLCVPPPYLWNSVKGLCVQFSIQWILHTICYLIWFQFLWIL